MFALCNSAHPCIYPHSGAVMSPAHSMDSSTVYVMNEEELINAARRLLEQVRIAALTRPKYQVKEVIRVFLLQVLYFCSFLSPNYAMQINVLSI